MKNSESINDNTLGVTELLHQLALNKEKSDDEIDLAELWRAVWAGKLIIVTITIIFSVASVFYSLSLSNIYQSQALLVPAEQKSGGFGGVASQLGGLASLAGVSIGSGQVDKTALTIQIMKSRAFIFKFIEKHKVQPELVAAIDWDRATNNLIYDPEIYDDKAKLWTRNVSPPLKPKPSLQESYRAFQKSVNITRDPTNSMVTISVQHYSPYVAQLWISWLIDAINEEMRARDLKEANNSIKFLSEKVEQTKVSDFKKILYQLIEEQTKTVMFANVRKQYALKTIDPALVPELTYGPKRVIICLVGFLFGFMLSVIFVLVRYFNKKVSVK